MSAGTPLIVAVDPHLVVHMFPQIMKMESRATESHLLDLGEVFLDLWYGTSMEA